VKYLSQTLKKASGGIGVRKVGEADQAMVPTHLSVREGEGQVGTGVEVELYARIGANLREGDVGNIGPRRQGLLQRLGNVCAPRDA
jgi:hypothetical protein